MARRLTIGGTCDLMNNYATFWQRFAAMWVDLFVLLPLFVVQVLVESLSKAATIALVIPMAVAYVGYLVVPRRRSRLDPSPSGRGLG